MKKISKEQIKYSTDEIAKSLTNIIAETNTIVGHLNLLGIKSRLNKIDKKTKKVTFYQDIKIPIPPTEEELAEKEKEAELNKKIVGIFNIFKEHGINIQYGHRGHRQAIKDMLSAMTYDEAIEYVNTVLNFQGEEYAPTISSPTDIKFKQDKINRFLETHKK